jgi:hypothetical protein
VGYRLSGIRFPVSAFPIPKFEFASDSRWSRCNKQPALVGCSDGSIDMTFGKQGAAITDFSSVAPTANACDVAIESNGIPSVAG